MKKLEKILGFIAIAAFILKLIRVPGASMLLLLSISALSLIYYPLGFAFFNQVKLRHVFKKEAYKGVSALRILGAIGVGVSLSALLVGILFKVQFWSGASFELIFGIVATAIIAAIALIRHRNHKDDFYKRILSRMALIGGLALLFFFTPELTILKIQYRNHPDYVKAFEASRMHPESMELREKMDIEYSRATMSADEFEAYRQFRDKTGGK